MSTGPIGADEMAGILQRIVSNMLCDIADPQHGGAFEMTAPATGQRFRVAVTEVPGWSEQMDQELAQAAGTEPQS